MEQKSGMSHLFNLSKIDHAEFQFSVIWDPKGFNFEVWWVPFAVNYFFFKSIWPCCAKEKDLKSLWLLVKYFWNSEDTK